MAVNTDYLNTLGAGSGLDTQAIVTAMVEAAKANKQSAIYPFNLKALALSFGSYR